MAVAGEPCWLRRRREWGGPYTEDNPPPGLVFGGYRKAARARLEGRSHEIAAPAEPQATEPGRPPPARPVGRQLAAPEAEKKAQQAAAEEAKAPEIRKARRGAAFAAAENYDVRQGGDIVEATKTAWTAGPSVSTRQVGRRADHVPREGR